MTWERFLQRIRRLKCGCWRWKGYHTSTGYAAFKCKGKQRQVSRWLWEHKFRRRLGRWLCRHICDNRWCVNPFHLIRGTHKHNVHDAIKRGRRAVFSSEHMRRVALARAVPHNKGKRFVDGVYV